MSNCSNCYNGCTEIVSDKCVKYTGVDVPILGIQEGDSLSFVEQALITFLTSTLDGTGIKPNIDPNIICHLVQQYLPTCGDITVVDLFTALIKAACDLQEQINATNVRIDTIEANYTVGCLNGVTPTSGTHNIVQAIITKLCAVDAALTALALDVSTNYVKLSDLDALIQAYLNSLSSSNQYYTKLIPYVAMEYYGPLTNFDASGKGLALNGFDKIYLCNGQNGTPDKRGRLPVGVTTVPGGGAYNPAVDPAIPGNPNYTLGATGGTNTVTLDISQIPSHTHVPTATVTDNHYHFVADNGTTSTLLDSTHSMAVSGATYSLVNTNTSTATIGKTSGTHGTLSVAVTNANNGGGLSHNNIPPVLACYYIMYIP